jgi:hypothetical protein
VGVAARLGVGDAVGEPVGVRVGVAASDVAMTVVEALGKGEVLDARELARGDAVVGFS